MVNARLTTAVPATAMFPAVVQVNAAVGNKVIVPPPNEIGVAAVTVSIAAVPEINTMGVVGAMVVALAMVGAAAVTALKLLKRMLVPVAAPSTGVTSVGVVANTATPVPVSSVNAASKFAEVKEPKDAALPTEVTMPVKLALVVTLLAVKLVAVPVMFVPTNADGVPNAGVTSVGEVAKTAEPVPVSSVRAVRKLALLGVAKNVATLVPKPLTPVATGKPVQLVNKPLAGVPNAGVTKVELVNNKALVTCFVVPPCTIGKTSVVAAAVATGKAEIAIVAMLIISCKNVKTLTVGNQTIRH